MRTMICVAAATMTFLGAFLGASLGAAYAANAPLYKTHDCSRLQVQMELNQCAGDNAEAADTALNAIYKKVLKQAPDAKAAAALKKSERAWMEYRDRECDREVGPQAEGGSIWPMEMSNCLEDKTAVRLRELKQSLDCPEGPAACAK